MGLKYSKEFMEDAVQLAEREGVAAASEKLGITKRHICEWRRKERLSTIKTPKGLKTGETVEEGFHRSENENEELREANYILKKQWFFCGAITGIKPRYKYAWIAENRGKASVALCCAMLEVRREGYYNKRQRWQAAPACKARVV